MYKMATLKIFRKRFLKSEGGFKKKHFYGAIDRFLLRRDVLAIKPHNRLNN